MSSMSYGIIVYAADGSIVCDGESRMLRKHTEGIEYFSVQQYWGNTSRTVSFSALDAEPTIIAFWDPPTEQYGAGWSLESTTSSLTIKLWTTTQYYSGYCHYFVFRQR